MAKQVAQHGSEQNRLIAEQGTILRAVSGSMLYGLSTGDGDRDEMGLVVEPPEWVIGLRTFEQFQHRTQPQGVRSGAGDLDYTAYSLRKWARLAADGNPTILLLGFTPTDMILQHTELGQRILDSMELFRSKRACGKFIGYCDSQLKQLRGEVGRKHTNRPELIQQYGFDTKFAAHAIRLGVQGREYLTTGHITLPMPESERSYLIGVRKGEVEYAEVCVRIEQELDHLRRIEESNDLRPGPAEHEINLLLQEIYMQHWKNRGYI